jgi:drug/metabolite transporter (DMT)-like permease
LAEQAVGWWLPVLLLILVSAVLAYPSGIVAVRRLGSSLASFVSLTEVIFAVIFAFLLLGQRPGLTQLLGGGLILAGIALVQRPQRPVGNLR